jgi:membrane protein YdbS with pleckstrin-like domain
VNILEITINAKQLIAAIWTVIAIVISVIVVLGFGLPFFGPAISAGGVPFLIVAAVFGVWLLIALPVYVLIAVWGTASKSTEE